MSAGDRRHLPIFLAHGLIFSKIRAAGQFPAKPRSKLKSWEEQGQFRPYLQGFYRILDDPAEASFNPSRAASACSAGNRPYGFCFLKSGLSLRRRHLLKDPPSAMGRNCLQSQDTTKVQSGGWSSITTRSKRSKPACSKSDQINKLDQIPKPAETTTPKRPFRYFHNQSTNPL